MAHAGSRTRAFPRVSTRRRGQLSGLAPMHQMHQTAEALRGYLVKSHFIVDADHLPPARSQSALLVMSEVDGLAAGGVAPRSNGADGMDGAGDGLVVPGVPVPESVPPVPDGVRGPLPGGD